MWQLWSEKVPIGLAPYSQYQQILCEWGPHLTEETGQSRDGTLPRRDVKYLTSPHPTLFSLNITTNVVAV